MANLLSQFIGSNSGTIPVEVFIVGGGGGAGAATGNENAGGGGSGQVVYGVYDFNYNKSINVSIGSSGLGSLGSNTPEPNVGNAGGDTRFGAIVSYGGGGGGGYSILSQWEPDFISRQNYGSSGGTKRSPSGTIPGVCCNFPLGSEFVIRSHDQGPNSQNNNYSDEAVDLTGIWSQRGQGGSTEGNATVAALIVGRKTTPNGFIAHGAGNHGDNNVAGGGGGAGGHPGYSQLNRLAARSDYLGSMQGSVGWYGRGGRGLPGSAIGYPTLEFAGGGGGGGSSYQPGNAGGGNGAFQTDGGDALANSGSGGGGGSGDGSGLFKRGGNGGSGVCIIRYPTSYNAATASGNVATPAQSGYHVYRWDAPGSITFNP
jgi:hypothetical protein